MTTILRKEVDIVNKFRVTITFDGINTYMIKYNSEVSDDVIMKDGNDLEQRLIQEEQDKVYLEQLMEEYRQLIEEIGDGNNKKIK